MSGPGCCTTGNPAVTFDPAEWRAIYPAMVNISDPAATNFFNISTLFVNNRLGPVKCLDLLKSLLYMVTAHLAFLFSPRDANGQPSTTGTVPAPTIVGFINGATEGSVSVQTGFASQIPMAAAFWVQTQYGLLFWQATAIFRAAKYYPGIRRSRGFGGQAWLYPNGS